MWGWAGPRTNNLLAVDLRRFDLAQCWWAERRICELRSDIHFDRRRLLFQSRNLCSTFKGSHIMTLETILIVGAITAAFAAFAFALWRAERLTRDLKREDARDGDDVAADGARDDEPSIRAA